MNKIGLQFFGGRGGGGSGGARGGRGGGGSADTKIKGVTVNLGGSADVEEAFLRKGLEIHASNSIEAVKNFNTVANPSSGSGLKMSKQNALFYQVKSTWNGKVVPAETYRDIEVYQVRPGVYKFRQL